MRTSLQCRRWSIDRACYYLGVRRAESDPAAGIATMAAQLHHFLHEEMDRGG